jgi:hypothetical protein
MHHKPIDQPVGDIHAGGISEEAAEILRDRERLRGRRNWRLIAAAVALVLVLALSAATLKFYHDWSQVGVIHPTGGLYFLKRVALPVPIFRQGDPQWRKDQLGSTPATIASEGCALSSAAMVMKYYGIDTDPHRLNEFLTTHEGYTPQGWIYWERAADLEPNQVRHAYEDAASFQLIDRNLLKGNPVIVKLKLPSGGSHFVVIAGKDGFDYLTCDPGAGGSKGIYPLKELGSDIQGLRFYERL